ncbi:MAG TPA: tape measure protein, partial [Pyrinomonadaceae bacterium]|nr:tape measure protein [Pyrinomonadaceae bacterium]
MADEKKVKIILELSDKDAIAAAKRLEYALNNAGKKGSEAIDGISTSTIAFAHAAGEFIGGVAKGAFDVLTSKIQQGTQALFDYTSQLEVTRKQFDQLTGSSISTKQILDDIRKFATDKGADVGFVSQTDKEMMRLQVSTKDTLRILDTLSDTVASLGGDQKMTEQLTSISTNIIKAGKLSLEAIKQIEDAGVPAERVWKALEVQTGKNRLELMYLARDSKISSNVIFEALENFNKANKFGDAAEKQTQTFSGAITKLGNILLTEGEKAFEPYFNKISDFTQQTVKTIEEKGAWATTGEIVGKAIAAGVMVGVKDVPEQLAGYIVNQTTTLVEKLRQGDFQGAGEQLPGGGFASFAKNMAFGILDQLGLPNGLKYQENQFKLHTAIPTESQKLNLPSPFNPEIIQQQIERQKKLLEAGFKDRLDVINQNLRVEEAHANNHLRLTLQDDLTYANKQKAIKQSSLKEQISLQNSYFNQQINLSRGDEKTITQLTQEKNRVLRGLSTEYLLTEINNQKQVQEIERKILEQRRQTSIQYNQLRVRDLSQAFDSRSFDLTRSISLGVNVQQSFDQLKILTAQNYQQIADIARQSYATQLANERLSAGERINLNKQMFLDLQELSEKNRQRQIEIQDRELDERIRKMDLFTSRTKAQIDSASNLLGQLDFKNKGSVISVLTSQFFNFDDVDKEIARIKNAIGATETIRNSLLAQAEKLTPNSKNYGNTIDLIKGQTNQIEALREALQGLESPNGLNKELLDLMRLGKQFDEGRISIDDFDKAQKTLLKTTQEYTMFGLEQQKKSLKDKVDLFQRNSKVFEAFNTQLQLDAINNQIDETKLRNSADALNLYRNSFEGLRETFQKFQSGDKKTWLEFYDNLRKQDISNQI